MSTTVSNYIEAFNEEYDNTYEASILLKYINIVESNVYADNIKEYLVKYYARTLDAYQFSLPSGINITEVVKLYVNGRKYSKKDSRAHKEYYTYWYEQSKLNIYPKCSISDTSYVSAAGDITFKAIAYTSGAGEITFASGTITTTGSSFVSAGFVVGNTITISGCTVNSSNNKNVVITAVTASTITVATGSFTAGAETGIVRLATNCIYTAGNNFTGFVVGDMVEVSGCTSQTANNKYSICTAVYDDVLTFASGTFTAQAEAAAVTITAPKIKMTYLSLPTAKLIANIATDTLLIPDRWIEAYDYFILSKIAYNQKEYSEAANHMQNFNTKIAQYQAWWEDNRPTRPEDDIVSEEDGRYVESHDFDTDT